MQCEQKRMPLQTTSLKCILQLNHLKWLLSHYMPMSEQFRPGRQFLNLYEVKQFVQKPTLSQANSPTQQAITLSSPKLYVMVKQWCLPYIDAYVQLMTL